MHRTSWRDEARKAIGELLKEAIDKRLTKREFNRMLAEKYPWQRTGWAYKSWLAEKSIALDYFDLIANHQLSSHAFEWYSLNRLDEKKASPSQAELEEAGQMNLFQ